MALGGMQSSRIQQWPEALEVAEFRARYPARLFESLYMQVIVLETSPTSSCSASATGLEEISPRSRNEKDNICDIEKDMMRTLPSLALFQDRSSVLHAQLHRMLSSYAILDPALGYCQSLNTIAAVILLQFKAAVATAANASAPMPQQDSAAADDSATLELCFWTFAALVSRQKPYYSRSMCGLLVDRFVLDDLLALREPNIQSHLQQHNVFVWSFCAPWFLCLFVQAPLPYPHALLVWDAWLQNGDCVLFQVALALFALNRETILSLHSSAELLEFFLHRIGEKHSVEKIMEHVVEGMNLVSLKRAVEDLREFHRPHVVRDLQSISAGNARRLWKQTSVPPDQVQALWRHFLGPSPWSVLVNGGLTSLPEFHRALASTVFHRGQMQQWVEHGLVSGVLLRLLRVLQDRTDARQLAQVDIGTLTFDEFMEGVSVFLEPSKRHKRLVLSFRFCNISGSGYLSREDLRSVLQMFSIMYTGQTHEWSEIEMFCTVAFEKVKGGTKGLNLHEFSRIVVLHPQLLNFFRLDEVLSGGIDLHLEKNRPGTN